MQDFNIQNEAKAADKAVIKRIKTVVRDKTLTIRFHWAGKGTTGSPKRGIYGPLISAISVDSGKISILYRPSVFLLPSHDHSCSIS